ncbi:MAG: transposase [Succinivibrio sp.]|nr:transposase [Succinivibrio sp.]
MRRHEDHILNTIETKLGNARVEAINNKIKLFVPLPNRCGNGTKLAKI